MHRFGGFASITMPQPLAYETFKCHLAEASSGDEDEVGSVDTTKGYLDNACKFFTSAKKHFEDIKKLESGDKHLKGASETYHLEDQLSIEKAKANMRVALTCWASAKAQRYYKSEEERCKWTD